MSNTLIQAVTGYLDTRDGSSPYVTEIDGLTILRSDHEKQPAHVIHRPALCITLQGAKWALFGQKRIDYRAGQAMMVSVDLPMLGRVAEASPDKPYLGIILELDLAAMRDVLEGLNTPLRPLADGTADAGVFVIDLEGPVAESLLRAIRLLETPQAIPTLFPLIMREVCYWLLVGPHGAAIAGLALANGYTHKVIAAIHELRTRFVEALRIE